MTRFGSALLLALISFLCPLYVTFVAWIIYAAITHNPLEIILIGLVLEITYFVGASSFGISYIYIILATAIYFVTEFLKPKLR
jgi:hypothetical protein